MSCTKRQIKLMDKETKKRISYNAEILILMKEKWDVSIDYVRKCLRGDRVGIMPDRIVKDYNDNVKVLEAKTKETVAELKTK